MPNGAPSAGSDPDVAFPDNVTKLPESTLETSALIALSDIGFVIAINYP